MPSLGQLIHDILPIIYSNKTKTNLKGLRNFYCTEKINIYKQKQYYIGQLEKERNSFERKRK